MSKKSVFDEEDIIQTTKSKQRLSAETMDEKMLKSPRKQSRRLSTAQAFTARVIGNIQGPEELTKDKEEEEEAYALEHTKNVPLKFYRMVIILVRRGIRHVKAKWNKVKHWYRRERNKRIENPILNKQIKIMEGHFGSGIGTMFVFFRWVLLLNIGLSFIWTTFIVIPMAVTFNYKGPMGKFSYKNLLDGEGPVGTSWFFFGAYVPEIGMYHLGLAYLIMILITYFGSLWIILITIAAAEEPMSGSRLFSSRFAYSLIMWTSWDHSVITAEATLNLSKGIASAFKDHMYEQKVKERKKNRLKKDPYGIISRRVLAWFITTFLICVGCTGIIYLEIIVHVEQSQVESKADMSFLRLYFTPVFISMINVTVPFCIRMLAKIEHYASGQAELNITLARIFILRMASLVTLIASVYYRATRKGSTEEKPKFELCTGTIIGQELYKLVIMDTVVNAVANVTVYFGYYFWTREKDEYIISTSVLVLIYRESLILCGAMTCPVLPVVGCLSNVEFFYLNYFIMLYTCKPPIKRWRQSRKTQFIMTFLLLSILCLIFPVSVVIGSDVINLGVKRSTGEIMGPFRNSKVPTNVFQHFINNIKTKEIQLFLQWMGSHTVVLPLILMLICFLGYQHRRFVGEHRHSHILQIELQQERADNKILAKKLYELKHIRRRSTVHHPS